MPKRYTEACDKWIDNEATLATGVAWDTEADALQANKIAVDRLCDMQKLFAMSLSLAFRMTPLSDVRKRIEQTTKGLHDDYQEWHAKWIKNPQYETLIPRLNRHIDVYEDLINWVNSKTSLASEQPNATSEPLATVLNTLKDLTSKVDQAGGLLAQVVTNTTPEIKSRKSYAVSQALAAEILTKKGLRTTERTIQNWEAGKGTPAGYSVEKCCVSATTFEAWADGYVTGRLYSRRLRKNIRGETKA